jgi:transcriptional regulator with XRE-family HTH domain
MEKSTNRKAFVSKLKERQLTQQQLAVLMGKSLRTVQGWVSGEYTPTLTPSETLRFCSLLECSLEELESMFPNKKTLES